MRKPRPSEPAPYCDFVIVNENDSHYYAQTNQLPTLWTRLMCHDHAYLRSRWDRIAIGIRCAYNPWLPPVILHYLEAGRRLVGSGAMDEAAVQRRMLTVLLQTAGDEALPWCWRAACLEHTVRPRARLATLLAAADPGLLESMEDAVQFAQMRLDAALLTGGHVSAKSPF